LVVGGFAIYLGVKLSFRWFSRVYGILDNMILYRIEISILIVIADTRKIYKNNTNLSMYN